MKKKTLSDKRIGQLNNQEVGKFYYPEKDVKEFIRLLKENWKKKCKRMDIMSGEVAIYELNCEIEKLSGGI